MHTFLAAECVHDRLDVRHHMFFLRMNVMLIFYELVNFLLNLHHACLPIFFSIRHENKILEPHDFLFLASQHRSE